MGDISLVVLLLALLGGLVGIVMRSRRKSANSDTSGTSEQTPVKVSTENMGVWEQAELSESSLTGRVFLGVAKPIARRTPIELLATQEDLGWLQRMLLAAGSPYGGSVEVFLSVQAAAMLIGLAVVLIGSVLSDIFPVWLIAGLGAVLMFLPISRLYDQARKRTDVILQDLPDFVDLLMIPIVAGSGIKRSLRTTADRFYGPVQVEINNAMAMVDVGKSLSDALWYAGHRLAVPEARVFFSALAQAEQQGASVRELLEKQRDTLRHESFQRQRAEIKKIPTRIVFAFALHFMPVLFAIVLVPLVTSLSQLG